MTGQSLPKVSTMNYCSCRIRRDPSSTGPLRISFRDPSILRTNGEFKSMPAYNFTFAYSPLAISGYFDGIAMESFTLPIIEAHANETQVSS